MTAITSGMGVSPSDRIKQQLAAAIASGNVKAGDKGAVSGALDDIGAAMDASAPTRRAANQDKIGDLIDKQVSDGKLSEDQAADIKALFADAMQQLGGLLNAGSQPAAADDDADAMNDNTAVDYGLQALASLPSPGSPAGGADSMSALVDFLSTLQTSEVQASPYGASGSRTANATTTGLSSLMIDRSM